MTDEKMLEKWLSNKENKAFENGIKYACEEIVCRCERQSMPILLSDGDDNFYISMEEIKEIIGIVNKNEV